MPSTQELFGDSDDDSSSSSSSSINQGSKANKDKEEQRQVSTKDTQNNKEDEENKMKDGSNNNNDTNDNNSSDQEERTLKTKKKEEDDDGNKITYSTDTTWTIPAFTTPPSAHIQPLLLKLPNFMGIQTQPFTLEDYDPTQEEDYFGPQSVWNLVRYRYTEKNGGKHRESNTRLVEWEDGSYTLHVGAEAFTVDLMDNTMLSAKEADTNNNTTTTTSFPGLNGYLYVSHKASINDKATTTNTTTTTTTLECVHPIRARGTLKPTSLQSAAHKALTISIRQQMINKRAKIANYQTTQDPEKLKQERIKVKQDLEKAALARNKNGDPTVSSSYRRGGSRSTRPRRSRAYMEDDYDDDDEDYDTTNIKAMKRRAYRDDDDDDDGDDDFGNNDDDEDDEGDTFHRVRPKKQARVEENKKDSKDMFDDDDDEDDGDDDDDDLVRPVVKANNKRNTQSLFDDDDDSE